MESSVVWFLMLAGLSVVATVAGYRIALRSPRIAWVSMCTGVSALVLWGWLYNNASTAVLLIPTSMLRYLEGVGGAPFFLFCAGIALGRATLLRQRLLAHAAVAIGVVYFVHGGSWMLQTTPADAMSQIKDDTQVLQSQDYSCVPAACATALTRLGVPASEAEMALLTQTRAGTGATVIRALDGLNRKLKDSHLQARLQTVTLDDLHRVELPALTALQYESSRTHMVVILRVDLRGILVSDPVEGVVWETPASIRDHFSGDVIAFERSQLAMR